MHSDLVAAVGPAHALSAGQVADVLATDRAHGLPDDEATRRLREQGANQLPPRRSAGPVRRLLRQLHHPLIYVLLGAAALSIGLGEVVDASVILGVVVVNALVGFVQESRAEAALTALRSMVRTRSRVVRGGVRREVASETLVTGDLVLLEAGEKVPADLRLVAAEELHLDESALTGESLPAVKGVAAVPAGTPVADRTGVAFSGTLVTSGTGAGLVVATGAGTELGEIHRLVADAEPLATPLTRKLASFSGWLTGIILLLAAVTFVIGVGRGEPAAQMFTAAVALAVGAIPEGLPAAVTITLAIGVARMARRRAVIRRLPAVETLGGATVICSDKTGTLTENRMTVRAVWSVDHEVVVPDGVERLRLPPDDALEWTLRVGAGCNDARLVEDGPDLGDPTETAMLRAGRRLLGQEVPWPRVGSLPFSSERQYMATLHRAPDTGDEVLMAKGAVERILDLCEAQMHADGRRAEMDRARVLEAAERLAARGMRVLATAVDLAPGPRPLAALGSATGGGLVLTGLQAMLDPPRSTAREAVRHCREAGLSVKMITGDHAATAESIARRIGLLDPDQAGHVLNGPDLEAIDDDHLPDAVERAAVFARVSPAQKLRLVRALQARHHVVAMTGDGVNDAPALRQADLGVAMGRSGTDVAKESGDMVLTDDDFASIEAAVEEGRGVFDNLTKFIVWTMPTNMGEGMVILVAVLLGSTLPILPTQILWINMTTAVLLGLMLAWEPKEPGLMQRPPRDPRRSLLTGAVVWRTVLVSAVLVVGTWWVFGYERGLGASVEASRTAAVNLFVTVEAFYLWSCRSLTLPGWRTGLLTNRPLLLGVALQALGQAALTYLPVMNTLFHTAPIGWDTWLRIGLVALVAAAVVSLDKRRVRDRPR